MENAEHGRVNYWTCFLIILAVYTAFRVANIRQQQYYPNAMIGASTESAGYGKYAVPHDYYSRNGTAPPVGASIENASCDKRSRNLVFTVTDTLTNRCSNAIVVFVECEPGGSTARFEYSFTETDTAMFSVGYINSDTMQCTIRVRRANSWPANAPALSVFCTNS